MAGTGLVEYGKKRHHPDEEHLDTSIAKKIFSGQEFVNSVPRDKTTAGSRIHSRDGTTCLSGLYNKSKGGLIWRKPEYAMVDSETSFGSFCGTVEGCSTDASSICVSTEGVLSADFSDGRSSREKSKLLGTVHLKDSCFSRLSNTKTGKLDAEQSEVTGIGSHANSSLTYEDEFREQSGISRSVRTRIQVKGLSELRPVPEEKIGSIDCASFSDRQQHAGFVVHSSEKALCGDGTKLLPIDEWCCEEPMPQSYGPSIAVGDRRRHSLDSVGSSSIVIKGSCTCLQDETIKGARDVRSNDSCQGEAANSFGRACDGPNEMSSVSSETKPGPDSNKDLQLADMENKDTVDNAEASSSSYVLSSGRLSLGEEAQLGRRTPTIDHDFEEYFSALML